MAESQGFKGLPIAKFSLQGHIWGMSDQDPLDSAPVPPDPAASKAAEQEDGIAAEVEADDPRWRLMIDVVTFQGKLFLDAIRDILLSPISIVLAIVGVISKPKNPGVYFYDLMRWGRWSDHFIGLFNAGLKPDERHDSASVDDIVDTLERVVRDEYYRGGLSAEARAHFERTLHRLEEDVAPEQRRLEWHIRRAVAKARAEARKLRKRITGPNA